MGKFKNIYHGYKKSEKFKYVFSRMTNTNNRLLWFSNVPGSQKSFDNERDAAIHADKQLIQNGKEPVNILKRKA